MKLAASLLAGLGATIVFAACSGGASTPNPKPGDCVLQNGVWYCGTGYGNWPDCNAIGGGYGACEPGDAGGCFSCAYHSAGETCGCGHNTDAGAPWVWQCTPSGTACSDQNGP